MKQGAKLEFVLYTSNSQLFLHFCEDIKIAIKSLRIRYSNFILKTEDYNLVLDQLLLKFIKFSFRV